MARGGAKPAEDDSVPRREQARGNRAAPSDEAPGVPDDSGDAIVPELIETVSRLTAERDRLHEELARARMQIGALERLADEDVLIPVANRRAFLRELRRTIAFVQRYGVPASVIYVDVNNMKEINDTYGHPAGDAALRHIAAVLNENIRTSDLLGRLGGDEFAIILAHASAEQAHKKAAALDEAVLARPLHWDEVTIPVSVAQGVYAVSGSDDAQRAIEAADAAMYRHKRAGSAP